MVQDKRKLPFFRYKQQYCKEIKYYKAYFSAKFQFKPYINSSTMTLTFYSNCFYLTLLVLLKLF